MIVILDNGHGKETKGKRSPVWSDGTQLFEWEFNRDVVRRISEQLNMDGIENNIIVPEEKDIPLSERVRRTNSICDKYGARNCLFISVHSNAGGGTGWEAYTTKGTTRSDEFCNMLYEEADMMWGGEWKIRRNKEENYTVIYGAKCPAVLIEYFFMDNEKDCHYIMSDEGRDACAEVAVNAIKRWIRKN